MTVPARAEADDAARVDLAMLKYKKVTTDSAHPSLSFQEYSSRRGGSQRRIDPVICSPPGQRSCTVPPTSGWIVTSAPSQRLSEAAWVRAAQRSSAGAS
jgi:hypothetical protein